MGIKLSGEQLAELALAKNAGDRIAYYTLLADFGDIYGSLRWQSLTMIEAVARLQTISLPPKRTSKETR